MSLKQGEMIECDRCGESKFLEVKSKYNGRCYTEEADLEQKQWLTIKLPFEGEIQKFCLCPKCKAELYDLLDSNYWCRLEGNK